MILRPKRGRRRDETETETRERARLEEALDAALKNTFPASDPISIEQPAAASHLRQAEAFMPRSPDRSRDRAAVE